MIAEPESGLLERSTATAVADLDILADRLFGLWVAGAGLVCLESAERLRLEAERIRRSMTRAAR